MCANRIFVHASVYTAFRDRLVARVKGLVVGNGMHAGVSVGPLISGDALSRVEAWVAEAVAGGARVLAGGARVPAGGGLGVTAAGHFYAPTVVEAVPRDCALARDEIFGPVVRCVCGRAAAACSHGSSA